MAKSPALDLKENRLLASLSAADHMLLAPLLKTVALGMRDSLEFPNQPIKHVYFPLSGIVSVVTASSRMRQIEIGIIGREGMTGVNLLMGESRSPHSTYVQSPGQGLRIRTADLRGVLKRRPRIRDGLLRFAQTFMVQTAYTALSNGQAKVTERLARWILMAHDRLDGNELPLTHEFLALMLAVRRPGVTAAMNNLEGRNFIGSKRGIIIVRDRRGLKSVARGLYGVPEVEYRRLIGALPLRA